MNRVFKSLACAMSVRSFCALAAALISARAESGRRSPRRRLNHMPVALSTFSFWASRMLMSSTTPPAAGRLARLSNVSASI